MALEPIDLFLELTKSPRPHRIIDYPRKSPTTGLPVGQVALQLLTPEEQARGAAAAAKYCRELLGSFKQDEVAAQGYASVYQTAVMSENLFRSVRRANDLSLPFFPSAEAARQVPTPDEAAVLIEAYADFQADVGPIEAGMDDNQVNAWLARITQGADSVAPFYLLSSASKNELIRRLAARLSA